MVPHLRRATVEDTGTVVGILIASKEASFLDGIDDHDRDVSFWTRRWRGYIAHGSAARQSRGDGWVFLAEIQDVPVGYVAYHHTIRHESDAELQNIYLCAPGVATTRSRHPPAGRCRSSSPCRWFTQDVRRL